MFQVSIGTPIRSAAVAAAFLALVAVGTAARDAASPDGPALGRADDYATRHAAVAQLTRLDDYGTRYGLEPEQLTRLDDAGTRHDADVVELGPADDYGTRHGR